MKCGCGENVKYSHWVEAKEVMSCNKYRVCLTHSEQVVALDELRTKYGKAKLVLEKIVRVNAMDYEYKAWAKQGLDSI